MIIHREQLLGWETQYLEMEGMVVDGALIRRLFTAHVTCKALYNIHHSLNQLQAIMQTPLHIFSSSGIKIHFRISVWNQTEKPCQLPHPSPALLQAGLCTVQQSNRHSWAASRFRDHDGLRELGKGFQTIQELHFPQRTVEPCRSHFYKHVWNRLPSKTMENQ